MDGVLVIDKPRDFTSFDVVAVMRRAAGERKIGHTGTLDPMATGVLPLLLGKATRAADLLPDTDKEYEAAFRLGVRTDTGDSTGRVLETRDIRVSREVLEKALEGFRGEIRQVPPMYSAVRVNGRRLYDLARRGVEVERESRPVTIYRLELTGYEEKEGAGTLLVSCSKGTYIRTLCEDVAGAVGTLGVMTSLRRTRASGYSLADAVSLEEARGKSPEELGRLIRPVESLFEKYPCAGVTAAQAQRFCNGGELSLDRTGIPETLRRDGQRLRVRGPEGVFLGLGVVGGGELQVLKLFHLPEGRKTDESI